MRTRWSRSRRTTTAARPTSRLRRAGRRRRPGASYPLVGVTLVYSSQDGDEVPFFSLHMTGRDVDKNVDLRLHEARKVLAELTAAVATLDTQ